MQIDVDFLIETINEEKTPITEQLSISLKYPKEDRNKIIENASKNFLFEANNELVQICNLARLLDESSYNEYSVNIESVLDNLTTKTESDTTKESNQNIIKNIHEEQITSLFHMLSKSQHTEVLKLCKAFLFMKRRLYSRAVFLLEDIKTKNRRIMKALRVLIDICNFHLNKPLNNEILTLIKNKKITNLTKFLPETPKLSIIFLRFLSSPFTIDKKIFSILNSQFKNKKIKPGHEKYFELLDQCYKGVCEYSKEEQEVMKVLLSESLSSFRDKKDILHSIANLLVRSGKLEKALIIAKSIDAYYLIGKIYHLQRLDHLAREYYRCSDSILSKYADFVIRGYPVNVTDIFPKDIAENGILTIFDLNRIPLTVVNQYLQYVCNLLAQNFGIAEFKFSKLCSFLEAIFKKEIGTVLRCYNSFGCDFIEKYVVENNKVFYLEKIRRRDKNDVVSYFDDISYLSKLTDAKASTRLGYIEKYIFDFYCEKLNNSLNLAPEEQKKYIYYNLWVLNEKMDRGDIFVYDLWERGIDVPIKNIDIKKYSHNYYVAYQFAKELKERGDKRCEKIFLVLEKYLKK
ncbi:hypothetical protein DMUE_4050 [Dictyocoela muelleri]|nr:hypothetical protein DMUE_4050 [Dictyocoela muelleri]